MKTATKKNKIIEGKKMFFNTEIPSDWEIKHFEELADIDKESLSGKTSSNYEFDYISLSDVDSDDFKIDTTKIRFADAPSRARRIVKQGDILMSTVRPNLQGFSLIRNEAKDLIASTGFAVITAKKCNNEYLFHYLFSSGIQRQVYQLLVGSNYPAINSSDVRKLKIPLPPINEQKAIANILSKADAVIHIYEKLIDQKGRNRKWLMQQFLTGKRRLKTFEENWSLIEIDQLFKPVDRYVIWNENELYNLISIRRRNGGVFFREPLYGHQIGVKKLKEVFTNDFVISKRQVSHGAWAVLDKAFNRSKVSDEYDCFEISNSNILNANFWKWYCQLPILTHYANVDSDGVHIEKSIFDYTLFKKRKVLIPSSVKEQAAIAQILQTADMEISLLKSKVEKLREQKKGLMQQLLTGKTRIK